MNRRRFIVSTLSAGLPGFASLVPPLAHAAPDPTPGGTARRSSDRNLAAIPPGATAARRLVVIELAGGNDGLNTVVPATDPLYRKLRPTLALGRADTVRLDDTRRLHGALAPLLPLWRGGEFAIVEGVGVTGPGLAHFRAAQVRRSGSAGDLHRHDDWVERALAARVAAASPQGAAATRPGATLRAIPASMGRFSDAAAQAADALLASDAIGAVRLTLPGFDTHCRQKARHAAALTELASGITTLRRRLQQAGRWNDVLIMTTSEFGRAAAENAQGGTEHGAAAPQLLLGGRVNGGFHGARPRLAAHGGAIEPGVDHRRVLATVLASWWGVAPASVLDDAPAALPGLFRV